MDLEAARHDTHAVRGTDTEVGVHGDMSGRQGTTCALTSVLSAPTLRPSAPVVRRLHSTTKVARTDRGECEAPGDVSEALRRDYQARIAARLAETLGDEDRCCGADHFGDPARDHHGDEYERDPGLRP